jgi:hypothetical protein
LPSLALIGAREAADAANSPTISGLGEKLGTTVLGTVYVADSGPWSGLLVATCLAEDGALARQSRCAQGLGELGLDLVASQYPARRRPPVRSRCGNYVGFYVGEDPTSYHVLGGNQGDRDSIMRLEKLRCVARRWPAERAVIGKPKMIP